MTCGYPDDHYAELIKNYQTVFNGFVGPTEVFVSGDTLQIKDYSKTEWSWSVVDPQAKYQRHETVFPQECKKVFGLGTSLLKSVE